MKDWIQSVEVAYFVHATEDGGRVDAAVASLLGAAGERRAEALEGHFGNQITLSRIHLVGEEASRAFSSIVSRMPQALRKELGAEMQKHLDEHSALYLRLDKQKLLAGELALTDSDPVRVRVKPRLYMVKGSAPEHYRRLME